MSMCRDFGSSFSVMENNPMDNPTKQGYINLAICTSNNIFSKSYPQYEKSTRCSCLKMASVLWPFTHK